MSQFKTLLDEKIKPTLIEVIESKLDEESKKDFYLALGNSRISPTTIVKVLSDLGIVTSKSSIQRWRDKTHE